jgi:hypothetical protein
MPTTMPTGGSSRARNTSAPASPPRRSGTVLSPVRRSGASDHTPTKARTSTTFSSIVSIARKAISTLVTGLPRPVVAAPSAAAGASVGAGSGNSSTAPASTPATAAESRAAAARGKRGGRSLPVAAPVSGSRDAAPSSRAPVRPLPIAASVKATSMASRRTQTSVNGKPKETKPTTAAKDPRAKMVQPATAVTSTAIPQSSAKTMVMFAPPRAAPHVRSAGRPSLLPAGPAATRRSASTRRAADAPGATSRAPPGRGRDCPPWSARAGGSGNRESAARKKKAPATTAIMVKVSATMLMFASPPYGPRPAPRRR